MFCCEFPLAPMLTFPVILNAFVTMMIVSNGRSMLKQDAQLNVYTVTVWPLNCYWNLNYSSKSKKARFIKFNLIQVLKMHMNKASRKYLQNKCSRDPVCKWLCIKYVKTEFLTLLFISVIFCNLRPSGVSATTVCFVCG